MPAEIDREVARLKLEALGVKIDTMTPEQQKYVSLLAGGHLASRGFARVESRRVRDCFGGCLRIGA